MAISAGNYIIGSAISDDTVLLTSGGSKSKGAEIISGGLTESDNRCYWKAAVVASNYNTFYCLNSGTKTGYMLAKSIAASASIRQGATNATYGRWLAVPLYDEFTGDSFVSGETYYERTGEEGSYVYTATADTTYDSTKTYYIRRKITAGGQQRELVNLRTYSNANLYLTVPDDGGNLYLSELQADTANQEFYFIPTTYLDKKLATPKELTTSEGVDYVVDATSGSGTFTVRWKCSKTTPIYEQRYRTRLYDETGLVQDWSDWTDWTMITATKKTVSKVVYMQSGTNIPTPSVDNTDYMQADIEVQERLTSAASASKYNRTGSITHGAAVDAVIHKWIVPSLSVTSAICRQNGLSIAYSSNYAVAGNTLNFISIYNGPNKLVENYILTGQDYQGEVTIPWDNLSRIPSENDTLEISVNITESNTYVSFTELYSLTVGYDAEVGLPFTVDYTLTDRMTIEAEIAAYDSVECYIQRKDLLGKDVWSKVEEIKKNDAQHRYFEIIQPFGAAPTLMWVVSSIVEGSLKWGCKKETLSDEFIVNTKYYVWNWIDDEKEPHTYILKYRAGAIMQPGDVISLPATKFVTTGRDYSVFRYSKTVDRQLDITGVIVNGETELYCTKNDAEGMIVANHTVYRQPDGKWYQTALKTVSFTREQQYYTVQIQQEAETR